MKTILCGLCAAALALSASVSSACPVAVQSVVVVAPQFVQAVAPACASVAVAAPQYMQQQAVEVQAAPQVVQSYSVPLAVAVVQQPFYSAGFYSQAFAFNQFAVPFQSAFVVNSRFRSRSVGAVQVNVAGGARVRVSHGLFGGTNVRIR